MTPEHSVPIIVGVAELLLILAGPVILVILWRKDVIRPGSFDRCGVRPIRIWPAWLYFLSAFSVFFAEGVGATLGAEIGRVISGPRDPKAPATLIEQASTGLGATLAGIAIGLSLLVLIASRTPGADHGVTPRFRPRDIARGLLAILTAYPVVYASGLLGQAIFILFTHRQVHALNHETLRTLNENTHSPAAWLMALTAVFGAPIVEELMFRVYIQTGLLRLLRRTWPAIFLTALIFAAVHLGAGVKPGEAYVLFPIFTLGVAMGIAYERTRTPIVPIVMHMAFNGVNVLLTTVGQ